MDQHEVWERIGPSFDETRQRAWPHVQRFLDRTPVDARILDVMCGNGRHLHNARRDIVGLDFSGPLCVSAATRGPVVQGDATRLPFADETFDACIYVAGLHGIPEADGRAASLAELHRVMRPGAQAQITVWSRHAPRFSDLDLPAGPADIMVPWRRGKHADRFYHLYTEASLRRECEAAGFSVLALDPIAIATEEPDNLLVWLKR